MCIVHITPSMLRRAEISGNFPKNVHLAYTRLATWQAARPPPLDSLSLLQESNLRKLWNLLAIDKGREISEWTQGARCVGETTRKGQLDMRTRLMRSKISLLFIVCAALLAFAGTAMALTADPSGNTAPSPTISSDKADYAPGELVTLSGGNWQPGESVNIKVNDTYGASWSRNVDVTADASGNITDQFNLPDSFVSDYDVTATGSSGTATTSFTDGNVTYSPTRLPATGLQAVTAGNSVNLAPDVTLTKTGGGADPVVNTPITVTNKTTGSLTGQTCGGAGTAIPSSWLSVASPTLPQTITTSQNVTFRVSPPANASAGTYTGAVELANSTTNNTNAVDVCLNVSAAPTAVNTTTTASSTTATYGNSSATLNANVSPASGPAVGSGTVTFTVKKGATTIGTVTSGTVSAGSASANFPLSGVNADTYTILANYTAGTGFNASNNSTQSPAPTLTVNKANQAALTVDSPNSGTFGEHLAITTSGGSGTGALSFQASGGACQIDNDNKLEITSGTGSCSVTATKAADDNYNSVTSDAHPVTVQKADQAALTVDDPDSGTFGQHLPIVTSGGTGTGALSFQASGGACQIDNDNKLEITSGTGSCSVTATKAADDNYTAVTSAAHPVTVQKADQAALTVTSPNSGTFGEHLAITTSGGSGTGALSFQANGGACQIDNDNKLEITSGTGSCSVTATKAADNNYNSVTSAAHPVTVQKAAQAALTVDDPDSGTFGQHLPIVTSGGTGTGALSFQANGTACQIDNDNKLEITSGTGSCSVTATKAADNNYNSVTSAAHPVTVQKAAQAALTVDDPDNGTFGQHLTITTSGGSGTGALSFQASGGACQIDNDNKLEITSGTGSCSVTATKAADDNYTAVTSAAHPVTVNKANQAALTVDSPNSGTFGEHLPIVTSGGTGTGALSFQASGGACQIDNDNKLEITSGTGSCSVTATKAADNNYNSVTSDAHPVTVQKADQAALTVDDPDSGTFGQHLAI